MVDIEKNIEKSEIQIIFNRVMLPISRKSKLLSLEGKSYENIKFNFNELPKNLNDVNFLESFVKQILKENKNNIADLLVYIMDQYYKLDDDVNNKGILKLLRDERIAKYMN